MSTDELIAKCQMEYESIMAVCVCVRALMCLKANQLDAQLVLSPNIFR